MARRNAEKSNLKIRPYGDGDRDSVVALWEACDLRKPWNDPDQDIALARETPSAEILIGEHDGKLAATVLVGHDGHRGYVYYLAVDPALRGEGFGTAIMRAAEAWLIERKVPKLQLLVRETNLEVKNFYAAIGYQPNPCHIMQRWLDGRAAPAIDTGRDDGNP